MEEPITNAGPDVHKETIALALAEAGKRSEVREYGTIANTPTALKPLASNAGEVRGWGNAPLLLRSTALPSTDRVATASSIS